jgi:hypothetical protein
MDEGYWIRLLPWRRKDKPESKAGQIKFAPKLRIADGWVLELLLVNRSSWTLWVKEATIALVDLNAKEHAAVPTRGAKYEILQNVAPRDSFGVSLARSIYDAAGRPQGRYSCLVLTTVLYHVFDEWCSMRLDTYHVEMAALTALDLSSACWFDKKIKKIDELVDFAAREPRKD